MKIYLIPGLGYDCRIFKKLDLKAFDVTEISWIEPLVNETIHQYARRLFPPVHHSTEKIILIGHSLGGIIAQEIASFIPVEQVILVSSIQSRKELPLSFKLVKPLRLSYFFTKEMSLKTIQFWGKGHGFETEIERNLFKSMVGKQSNFYLKWALNTLSSWREPNLLPNTAIIQIHGTRDKTFPYKLIRQPDFTIENGSHICVLKKPSIISEIIKKQLQNS